MIISSYFYFYFLLLIFSTIKLQKNKVVVFKNINFKDNLITLNISKTYKKLQYFSLVPLNLFLYFHVNAAIINNSK